MGLMTSELAESFDPLGTHLAPDADRFDVTRTPTRHFGFGAGVHTCVGAAPARAQARIALQTLVERLPGLRPAPDRTVPLRRSINVRGPLALEMRW
jgi:hypothetical protein